MSRNLGFQHSVCAFVWPAKFYLVRLLVSLLAAMASTAVQIHVNASLHTRFTHSSSLFEHSSSALPSDCFQKVGRRFSLSVSAQTCERNSGLDKPNGNGIAEGHAQALPSVSRRDITLATISGMVALASVGPALADYDEDYKKETQDVINAVKTTLNLDKTDPAKADAVASLRQSSNDWVAKYRREKKVAGKPSFSNMYSVLNAISGHYISFGPTYPIPVKRRDRILEEVKDAEKALSRGR